MTERRYKLVFRGEINASTELHVVKQYLAQALQASSQCVDSMFALSETCVRSGLRQETAQKLKDHLQQQTGARFLILPEDIEPDLPKVIRAAQINSKACEEASIETPKTNYLIFSLFILCFVMLLSINFWSSYREQHIHGPSQLVIAKEITYLISHDQLILIHTQTQKVMQSILLSQLGIHGQVSDMEVDPEGNIWLADIDNQHLLRCHHQPLQCQVHIDLTQTPKSTNPSHPLADDFIGTQPQKALFFFHIEQKTKHIYVSETTLNRVRTFNLEGKELFTSDPTLKLPRKMIWHNKQLLLVDWGQQRIAVLDQYEMDFKQAWRLDNLTHYVDKEDRFDTSLTDVNEVIDHSLNLLKGIHAPNSPLQIVSDQQGGYWLLCSDLFLTRFQLLHLNQKQHIDRRYDIPSSHVLSIALAKAQQILITDDANMQILSFDTASNTFTPVIYPQLKHTFKDQAEQRNMYRQLIQLTLYLLYAQLGLAIILSVQSLRKRKKAAQ